MNEEKYILSLIFSLLITIQNFKISTDPLEEVMTFGVSWGVPTDQGGGAG